jgi:hypothetical protein
MCGKNNDAGYQFCGYCGAPLPTGTVQQPYSQSGVNLNGQTYPNHGTNLNGQMYPSNGTSLNARCIHRRKLLMDRRHFHHILKLKDH